MQTAPQSIHSNLLEQARLSKRELDVLKLLLKGRTYREIAAELFISKHTSREYIARVYTKLGVSRRSTCVAKAISMGLEP